MKLKGTLFHFATLWLFAFQKKKEEFNVNLLLAFSITDPTCYKMYFIR